MKNNFTVISFYTVATGYEQEIEKLRKSLSKFNLPYHFEAVDNLGDWFKNTRCKVPLIREMLKTCRQPIVYTDADSIIQKYPELFDTLDCDLGIVYRNENVALSGTMYLQPTENIFKLLDMWEKLNNDYPNAYEHNNLTKVISIIKKDNKDFRLVKLPKTYCQIFDLMKDVGEPVIEHFQASRILKLSV